MFFNTELIIINKMASDSVDLPPDVRDLIKNHPEVDWGKLLSNFVRNYIGTKDNDLTKLIGILPENKIDELEEAINEQRRERSAQYKAKIEELMVDNDS
jgi:hypothetical protein